MSKSTVATGYSGSKHKSTLGGSYSGGGMSKGVEDGLSSYSKMNVDESAPRISTDGSHAGFATERIMPRVTKSVSSKGKTFQVEK
jgi:hypothetical protein